MSDIDSRVELPLWARAWEGEKRYKVAYGGRGSSKSYTLALKLLVEARGRKVRILACREIQTSIKSSVYQLL
jgi:phage terminase large subunit